jgi:hypothetical protein
MPEPNRHPWRIAPDLDNVPISQLLERCLDIALECEACPHVATWTPEDVRQRLGGNANKTFNALAKRLRCSRCRSGWVRISLAGSASGRTGGARHV